MRMINKNRTLRTVGVLLCCALLATTFQVEKSDAPVSIPVSAKSVEELRTEKEQNAAKIWDPIRLKRKNTRKHCLKKLRCNRPIFKLLTRN